MNLFNRDCTIGTALTATTLVQYDVDKDEIVRDQEGHCVRVGKGEAGLLLGPITKLLAFDGYTDAEATEKKILRNVFEEGDAYFNSGDLIRQVDAGFALGFKHFQFVDRVGDTFRWKGENVSTNEVAEVLSGFTDIGMVNVYGVQVPNTDGRAGMVAFAYSGNGQFDGSELFEFVSRSLPSYAAPLFLRIVSELDVTGTFKLKKVDLQDEGWDLERTTDRLFYRDDTQSAYLALTASVSREIHSRQRKL